MELEPQIMANSNINMFHDTVFFDILSQTNYPINHYKNPENEDINMLNNNVHKSELSINNMDMFNQNIPQLVKLPLNMMPPPPHKIVNYNNNVIKRYQPRDNTRPRDSYRPISPKGYDSDESCTSYSSRGTPPDHNGLKYSNSRSGMNRLGDQTILFGKYSHSSPNVFHSNIQYPSNAQHNTHSNGNFNKNR
ncbi:hypothetical protein NQ314_007368 [Rhamnusium bicolor]|uniref:Uncharacterized protein n=1 Tax=Rhamnusium bicolor TaxID=1586634 RepID=A0AAV8YPY9_9CUCU|nr:hypothetical protein NQ314_007368 [Rhamnusium bicolor]